MKLLLLPFAFLAAGAIACPGDAAKSAAATTDVKMAAAAKAAPSHAPAATPAVANGMTKVSAKPAPEARKPSSL